MLHEEIKGKIKDAMIAKDEVLLKALRNMVSAFTNELVSKGKKPNEFLNDDDTIAVITRLAKQRKDAIEQFKNGGRPDLVEEESAELSVLEKYLPTLMDKNEVLVIAVAKKEELGISDPAKKGMLMAAL
ncbi:MAG: GatB/YqeY domain-containing protein, partial [Candidatus Paceibacteria bacterium]